MGTLWQSNYLYFRHFVGLFDRSHSKIPEYHLIVLTRLLYFIFWVHSYELYSIHNIKSQIGGFLPDMTIIRRSRIFTLPFFSSPNLHTTPYFSMISWRDPSLEQLSFGVPPPPTPRIVMMYDMMWYELLYCRRRLQITRLWPLAGDTSHHSNALHRPTSTYSKCSAREASARYGRLCYHIIRFLYIYVSQTYKFSRNYV